MGYLEQLRPASFRGVPFFVDEVNATSGKRAQIHEYAERDDIWVEELGAKAWIFPVTAHLLGDDVFEQRDRLIEALKRPGPGTLGLPADGEIEATCLDIQKRDQITGHGRISRLGLTFVESGKNQFPESSVETSQVVRDQGDVGLRAVEDRFSDLFKMPALQPTYLVDSASDLSTTVLDGLDGAIRRANAEATEKDLQVRGISAVVSDVRSYVKAPANLASKLTATYRSFVALEGEALTTFDELDGLADILDATPDVASGTAHRAREAQNQAALQSLNKRAAVIEMARVAPDIPLASSRDATALRDRIDTRLDAEIISAGDVGDYQVFAQLRELRAKTVQDLDVRGARLPALRVFVLPATLP